MEINILNKKSLATIIADKHGLTKKESAEIVDSCLDSIIECLKDGGKVDLNGFGKFEVVERAERSGINPSTKEKITIAASKAPKFKPAKVFKEAIK